MMGRRQQLKDGYEVDVVTGWRRFYRWKPGILRYAKRRMNKRYRREAKEAIRKEFVAEAQLVERLDVDQEGAGSIPVSHPLVRKRE